MAIGTGPLGTETALPRSTEESATVTIGTLADEIDLSLLLLPLASTEKANLVIGITSKCIDRIYFLRNRGRLLIELL